MFYLIQVFFLSHYLLLCFCTFDVTVPCTSVMSNYVQETILLKFYNFAMYISREANALGLTIQHKFTDINSPSFGKGDFFVSHLMSNDTRASQYIMSYQIMLAYCLLVNLWKLYIRKAWKISRVTDIIWTVDVCTCFAEAF